MIIYVIPSCHKTKDLLDFDLFVYFRLHSHWSSPRVFYISLGQPRSVNPHSQDSAMTNICRNRALQLLIKRRTSRSKTTRGWQPHFHLLPSLPYCVFPPLSTKISLWGRLFSSTFLKELLNGTGSFRSCFYGTERTPWLDCGPFEDVSFFVPW